MKKENRIPIVSCISEEWRPTLCRGKKREMQKRIRYFEHAFIKNVLFITNHGIKV